jgi:hypothetical protein
MDMDARVLAISRKFGPDDVDERWKETYETGVVQLKNVGIPVITMEGEYLTEWGQVPRSYYSADGGINYIAANIQVDNENVAAFLIQEFRTELTPAHCQLSAVFCEVLRAALKTKNGAVALRSKPSILLDLLEGATPEGDYSKKLVSDGIIAPLLLIVIRSVRDNTPRLRKGSMLTMIRKIEAPNISLDYEEDIICVISDDRIELFVKAIMNIINPQYYMVGISLPFEGWNDIPTRYKQALFAISMGKRVSGVYNCKDYAFQYLVAVTSDQNHALDLGHPALFTLRVYDREQNTNFYETLYHYIANERSHAETSKAMGIHRNTLMYRIKRICELIGSDLQNPDERAFIYVSYKMNE